MWKSGKKQTDQNLKKKKKHCELIKTVTKTNLKENCTDIDLLLKKKKKMSQV